MILYQGPDSDQSQIESQNVIDWSLDRWTKISHCTKFGPYSSITFWDTLQTDRQTWGITQLRVNSTRGQLDIIL